MTIDGLSSASRTTAERVALIEPTILVSRPVIDLLRSLQRHVVDIVRRMEFAQQYG
jgi:hypothetical protein